VIIVSGSYPPLWWLASPELWIFCSAIDCRSRGRAEGWLGKARRNN